MGAARAERCQNAGRLRQRAAYFFGLERLDVATETLTRRGFLETLATFTDGIQGHFACSGREIFRSCGGINFGARYGAFDCYLIATPALWIRDWQGSWGRATIICFRAGIVHQAGSGVGFARSTFNDGPHGAAGCGATGFPLVIPNSRLLRVRIVFCLGQGKHAGSHPVQKRTVFEMTDLECLTQRGPSPGQQWLDRSRVIGRWFSGKRRRTDPAGAAGGIARQRGGRMSSRPSIRRYSANEIVFTQRTGIPSDNVQSLEINERCIRDGIWALTKRNSWR